MVTRSFRRRAPCKNSIILGATAGRTRAHAFRRGEIGRESKRGSSGCQLAGLASAGAAIYDGPNVPSPLRRRAVVILAGVLSLVVPSAAHPATTNNATGSAHSRAAEDALAHAARAWSTNDAPAAIAACQPLIETDAIDA